MADDTAQTTLRDTIEQSFTEVVKEPTAPTTESAEVKVEPEVKAETEEQKAQRLRDEKGRFAPGKIEQKAEEIKDEIKPEAKPRPQRPSSWKKEMWEPWEKLDPQVAEYINQREQEFSKGVSTYKQEWDRAKPLLDVMAQFQPLLQQANIEPAQWISNLGNAHRVLALGTPEQKLQAFKRLAQDYQVPLQGVSSQEKPEFSQYLNPITEQLNQLRGQLNSFTSRAEQEQQMMIQRDIDAIAQEKDAQGNLLRPHFEEVRETMAGLLQSGLADDLKTAYDYALRHPRHKDIFDSLQQQQAKAEADRKAEEERQRVLKAKAQTVSTRTATPGAPPVPESKGLRADLEASFDAITGGRV